MLHRIAAILTFVLIALVLIMALIVNATQGEAKQTIPNAAKDKPAPINVERKYLWHE